MSNEEDKKLEDEMDLKFPVITISVSYDDINEPIHVDLGSVPPFVALSVFQSVIGVMRNLTVGPKITFGGDVLAEPGDFETIIDFDEFDEDDEDDDDDDDEE